MIGGVSKAAVCAESALTGPRPPYELTRSLQALQDQMVLGSHAAGAAQQALLIRIGNEFSKAPHTVWREPANARAAIVYVLSGGWPHFLRRLIDSGALPEDQTELARGALAYATGRRDEAWAILRAVNARALPPSLGAHVALVQASLTMEKDPAQAAGYLETARLLAPGTLIEDAALRREVTVASDRAEAERFMFLARQYIRRFQSSVYAANFVRAFPQLWVGLGLPADEESLEKLKATVAGLDAASRRELYLALARHRLVAGDAKLAAFAAEQATELSPAGSPEAVRGALYRAAAEVAGGNSAGAVEKLRGIDPARLVRTRRRAAIGGPRHRRSGLARARSVGPAARDGRDRNLRRLAAGLRRDRCCRCPIEEDPMKGGPEIRLTSALAAGPQSGRSTEGGSAKGSTGASTPFETLFARLNEEPAGKAAKAGNDRPGRPAEGPIALDGRKAKLRAAPEGKADREVDAADERPLPAEPVRLDPPAPGQSLATAVAQRIAAVLDGPSVEAAPAGAAPGARPEARQAGRGVPIAADLALAIATARGGGLTGKAGVANATDFSVTRRETHFAPALDQSGATGDAAEPAATSAADHGSGPLVSVRGRAEQVMMAARAGLGDARAARGGVGSVATGTAAGPAAGATRAGDTDGIGADAPEGPLVQSATTGGIGQGRGAVPAPLGTSPVAQPAAPTVVTGTAGPLRVLHIHLQPAELGALEVRMRMTDAGLEVHIEATRHETLVLLKNDREALAQVLRGTGHSVDTVSVTLADKSAAPGQPAQDNSASFGARGDTQAGGQSGAQSGAQSGGQSGAQSGAPRQQDGRAGHSESSAFEGVHDEQDQLVLAVRRHGDLYL